ncbi:MAG TPA: ABC transporter permease [Caulobacteraceae bacterium]
MRRLARIAVREYLAYVRTPGFWLSILLLPLGLAAYAFAPVVMAKSTPIPNFAVADFTGRNLAPAIAMSFAPATRGQRPLAALTPAPEAPLAGPAEATARLRPYLTGRRTLAGGGVLDAFAVIRPEGRSVAIAFWSRDIADRSIERAVRDAVAGALRRQGLAQAGLDPTVLASIDALQPKVTVFSPKAKADEVRLEDRLPGIVGFAMGMLLWMVVLTGAGMLLNSVIEEKTSRILEVLLTSASATEIMGGKILGVAAVTATVLGFWLTIAATVLGLRFPDIAADLIEIMFARGLWAYFALYFIGGYLMFATLYVTIGAFCESNREAQTLLGPMMIAMSLPMVFMSQAITRPDAPLLQLLAWIPPFTPFMMAARVASNPPLWQVAATGALMFAVTALELWVAIPAFKSGALATGRFELRTLLASLARRGG